MYNIVQAPKGEPAMKKHFANIISSSRIIGAVILFFFSEITGAFLTVYIYCGFSDLIDGPVARKIGSVSVTGARLDTVGDVLTYFALTKILIIKRIVPLWGLIWFGVTLIGFVVSAIVSKVRFNRFYFVHSLFGKILGVVIFLMPLAVNKYPAQYIGLICSVATIAAVESIIIQLKSTSLKTDAIPEGLKKGGK